MLDGCIDNDETIEGRLSRAAVFSQNMNVIDHEGNCVLVIKNILAPVLCG